MEFIKKEGCLDMFNGIKELTINNKDDKEMK